MDVQAFRFSPFEQVSITRPAVLATLSPDNVPSLQQLQDIHRGLLEYKKLHTQRLKQCEDQISIADEQYSKLKDRDRAKDKQLKKEPLEGLGQPSRPQKAVQNAIRASGTAGTSSSAQPAIPSASTSSKPAPRAGSVTLREGSSTKLNKKKRKRAEEAEEFLNDGTARNSTPHSKSYGHKEHKSKKSKHDDHDLRTNPAGFRKVADWSESVKGGLPPRPPRNPLPIPQTDDPGEVNDDMSDRKQPPNQVTAHTYWNYIEPWTRQIKDEDIAFLAFNGDDEECWEMPPLGRHYSEIWEEQDRFALDLPPLTKPSGSRTHNPYAAFTNPVPPSAGGAMQSSANAALRWDPASLTDADCVTEEHGSGPITERVFSAFMHLPNSTKMEEDDTYRGHGMGRAAGQGTVGDLEERLMKECRALGLILDSDEPDYSQPQDDQIASELRRCQRALRAQIKINEARKKRLLAIAEMRLAYAEYEEIKEGMERNISNMFSKLGNSGVPKVTRKKKKEKDKVAAAAAVDPASGGPAGISGLGLVGMDGNLQIPAEIYEPVKVLKQWKATLGAMYDQLEAETPGLIRGLPQKSIYEGIEDELVETHTVTSTAPDNAMDGVVTNGDADQSMDVVPFASSPDDVLMNAAD
ncbi:hypothetical protein CPB86DRAFT_870487 [Serendipita vermifera]|nr:hypothetical protein CPB86DRAFT_870487 [Serendipita vermifera]